MKKITWIFLFCAALISKGIFADNPPIPPNTNPASPKDMSPWLQYANNLKTCTPNTFNLPNYLQASIIGTNQVITYQIIGMTSGHCQVKMSITTPDNKQITMNCSFAQADLAILSQAIEDHIRDYTAGKSVNLRTDSSESKIMVNSCSR